MSWREPRLVNLDQVVDPDAQNIIEVVVSPMALMG